MATALAAAVVLLCLVTPAAAQVTEEHVMRACAEAASPPPGATYAIEHIDWADLQFELGQHFPGRQIGDVMIEMAATARPIFACQAFSGGAAAGERFEIVLETTGRFEWDALVCTPVDGISTMIAFFPGFACPFSQSAGFHSSTSMVRGPYPVTVHSEGGDCTVFRPRALGENGVRHPLVIWGNGTLGSPANHATTLSHFASHGFVVVAANTGWSGSGAEMTGCLERVLEQANDPASPYHRKINTYRIAAMGYSQGGGGALMAGRDPRVATSILMNPYVDESMGTSVDAARAQSGEVLMFSGAADTVAAPEAHQRPIFEALEGPGYWVRIAGAGHLPTIYQIAAGVAWARWRLMGVGEMEPVFFGEACTLCIDPGVDVLLKGFQ